MDEERGRLAEPEGRGWKRWGPYLSERQWGTVREDYSDDGNAWGYFSHDQSRSRAYRWGEDGIAGISDDKQRLCFALAAWNGADPILKERLFGLTNAEGNHGEDVKELYYYLDSTPTHSYMKALYKYPHRAYPYDDLVRTNGGRGKDAPEYELLDTGVFDQDRYFDVFVEYAKAEPGDVLIRITACNRGTEAATLHVLPHLWFRNTWQHEGETDRPELSTDGPRLVHGTHPTMGEMWLTAGNGSIFLFTENETNPARVPGTPPGGRFFKDGINDWLVQGKREAVNPAQRGTKCAVYRQISVPGGGQQVFRYRLSGTRPGADPLGAEFDRIFQTRIAEADDFFRSLTPPSLTEDQAGVLRQALAGMLWGKQYYSLHVEPWLQQHSVKGQSQRSFRNSDWFHMVNDDVISMPDKWEYPWYAAWDLAFHTIPLAIVDHGFAKRQLELMLDDVYLHPNGQIPAYEWNFSDVNPPVHAWATLLIYAEETARSGKGDVAFLRRAFHKLLLNFTWWVNRKDPSGRNVFEGGFLGLDNIGVFDRSKPLPTGGRLEQADGTAWMALFSQNMLEISLELASEDPVYEEMASKFLQHFFWIASAMDRLGENNDEMWDEEDGFFYDVLRFPDGGATRLKVRSLVGLLPLCATTVISEEVAKRSPQLARRAAQFAERHPELTANIADPRRPGHKGRRLFAICDEKKLRRILARLLDEKEFLGPHGIRSLSRVYAREPYFFEYNGTKSAVAYLPGDSDSGLFGGNSNWRGPVWFPINALILRALVQFYLYFGDEFRIECPTGSGQMKTLYEVAMEISGRLAGTFLRDGDGRRPVHGNEERYRTNPHWRDLVLFYEYFHGDTGAGIGASHQTGWTGLVARLLQISGSAGAQEVLEGASTRPFNKIYRRN
jgi:hypothetical protein